MMNRFELLFIYQENIILPLNYIIIFKINITLKININFSFLFNNFNKLFIKFYIKEYKNL